MTRLHGPRVMVHGAALADAQSPTLVHDTTLLVVDGLLAGLWTDGSGPDPKSFDATVIDGAGATIIPGLVDSHSHLCMPGGARWIERGLDPVEDLLAVGHENGDLLIAAGVRWARDVGAPRRRGRDGRDRAVSLELRDAWRGRTDLPYIRAAGTWLARPGTLPPGLAVEVDHASDLGAAVRGQLDDGADLVKLYLDGPDPATAPFTATEIRAAVAEAHDRGATVAAHASALPGARVGAEAGVDSLEHGFELDTTTATLMARHGVTLVSTLTVTRSAATFSTTSPQNPLPLGLDDPRTAAAWREAAEASVRVADGAGVTIAAGTDFGGGSGRANQLAWEFQALVEAGLAPVTALAACTWRGGDLMRLPDAGRLRVGAPAHFSLVHGDPLSDPGALWRIWLTR